MKAEPSRLITQKLIENLELLIVLNRIYSLDNVT